MQRSEAMVRAAAQFVVTLRLSPGEGGAPRVDGRGVKPLVRGREPLFRALALFDIVCNNADRKSGHCLLDDSSRVWAVDHGLTFHCDDKLRTVIWDFAGKPVGPSEREAMTRLGRALQEGQPLAQRLGELLTQEELSTLQIRVAERLGPSTYPHPASSWSFPWPLI